MNAVQIPAPTPPAPTPAPHRPAWREPMVWLVTALPAAVLVAGISTLVIAVRAGGDDALPDDVRRTAQIQVADLDPDARAQALGLAVLLRVDGDALEVLPVSGAIDRTAPMRLRLRHPTAAAADRDMTLTPTALGWRAPHALDGGHDWRLELGPDDGQWRLVGRLQAQQRAARLSPALAE